jgi:hypothetical protein
MSHFEWVMDYSASYHMFSDSLSFTYVSHLPSIPVITVDGTLIPLAGVGSVVTPHLSFPNVYLISILRLNFYFVGHLCDFGDYLVIFPFLFVMYMICNLRS